MKSTIQHLKKIRKFWMVFVEKVHKMFINVHIGFIQSVDNSDNRYKKPSASYLEQGSSKGKSPYCPTPDFLIPTITLGYTGFP